LSLCPKESPLIKDKTIEECLQIILPMLKEDASIDDHNGYRQYINEEGEVVDEEGMKCFLFFVENILFAVNAQAKCFSSKEKRERVPISGVYSASDEAFALWTLQNYHMRWLRLRDVNDPKVKRSKEYDANYTSSNNGLKGNGISDEGYDRYTHLLALVEKKRANPVSGRNLEDYMRRTYFSMTNKNYTKVLDSPPSVLSGAISSLTGRSADASSKVPVDVVASHAPKDPVGAAAIAVFLKKASKNAQELRDDSGKGIYYGMETHAI
jgi:hypothetical protein